MKTLLRGEFSYTPDVHWKRAPPIFGLSLPGTVRDFGTILPTLVRGAAGSGCGLCVARRPSTFQKGSIGLSFGLSKGGHGSAMYWWQIPLPVVERYRSLDMSTFPRSDAALVGPELPR
jgi:hypothetical protein